MQAQNEVAGVAARPPSRAAQIAVDSPVDGAGGGAIAPTTAPVAHPAARWLHRHVLDLDDFSRDEVEHVLETTDAMREVLARDVPRVPALRGTTVATLFYEASTRTRASFELA